MNMIQACICYILMSFRFKEREENVKADIFHAYIALLRHTRLIMPQYNLSRSDQPVSDKDSKTQDVLFLLTSQVGL